MNPLTNVKAMTKLNPYSLVVKRAALLQQEKIRRSKMSKDDIKSWERKTGVSVQSPISKTFQTIAAKKLDLRVQIESPKSILLNYLTVIFI